MAEAELANREPSPLAERALTPDDLRRALELRAQWAIQDDAALLGALHKGSLDGAERSVRILPTGEHDPDGTPIFDTVGPDDSPDAVLAPMVGQSFTIRHQAVNPLTAAPAPGERPHRLGAGYSRSSSEEGKK